MPFSIRSAVGCEGRQSLFPNCLLCLDAAPTSSPLFGTIDRLPCSELPKINGKLGGLAIGGSVVDDQPLATSAGLRYVGLFHQLIEGQPAHEAARHV